MDRDVSLSPCSVHLSESPAEVEFIATGGGPWRALLEDVGAWDPEWTAPGVSPVQYLEETGFLDARVLAVHGVQMTRGDLARLAASGATLVTCPRSNGHTGAGAPPLDEFYASGRPRRGRHRQSGQHGRLERVRRARHDAGAGAVGAARRRFSTARRGRAHGRWASPLSSARSNQAAAAASSPSRSRPTPTMWKNIWCPACRLNRLRGSNS